jgi:hypothetical protein
MRRTNLGSLRNTPSRIVPEAGQIGEDDVDPFRPDAGDIFQPQVSWS